MDPGGAAGSASNSSDFVRKLYKMLEDPSYSSIVRWGDEGDSFVVLENEKFTKTILPKHFKHSNFASFVRQLNKYDFHKVRQNNEENGTSPYGAQAWEFKHPEFKANNKDSLDNIRRKAPTARKAMPNSEEGFTTQQIDLMNQQLMAQQQQIQHLTDSHSKMSVDHHMMMQELLRVQKTVLNHEHVIHQVMSFLHSVDAKQRRDSKVVNPFAAQNNGGLGQTSVELEPVPEDDDVPASPLQHASKLLNEMNADVQLNLSALESLNDMYIRTNGAISTPPMDQISQNGSNRNAGVAPTTAPSYPFGRINGDNIESAVYPVGATNGIDPMYSEHVHNIPYVPPTSKELEASDPRRQFAEGRKKSLTVDPGWVRAPQVLLVEDDPTCRQIGGKFLYSFNCVIDTAFDGLEAVTKMESGNKYDLILMDIIMPNLDGVSACHLIRQFSRTPVIAMTSNIRSDDIQMYFQHGMDDVLPKPFTRKSLLEMLEKHLGHLKRMAPGIDPGPPSATTTAASMTHSATQSAKDDSSPSQSPSAGGSMQNWNSPGHFSNTSLSHQTNMGMPAQPNQPQNHYVQAMHNTSQGGYMDGGMGAYGSQVNAQQRGPNAIPSPGHRRQISDINAGSPNDLYGRDPKRQRMFNAQAAGQRQ